MAKYFYTLKVKLPLKISVITVCYQASSTIRATIESVLLQTYSYIEYIIIDGGSTDNTKEIISSYAPKIARIVSEPDNGIYDAMNKGVNLATGEIIAILNSDDLYAHQNVLQQVANAFNKSETDAVYGDLDYVKRTNTDVVTRRWRSGICTRKKMYHFFWQPPHPALFLKSAVYDKVGLFNLQYQISADIDLMVRIFYVHQCSHSYLPGVMVKMRTGGISTSGIKSRLIMIKEYGKILKNNHIKYPFYAIPLRIFLKVLQYF